MADTHSILIAAGRLFSTEDEYFCRRTSEFSTQSSPISRDCARILKELRNATEFSNRTKSNLPLSDSEL